MIDGGHEEVVRELVRRRAGVRAALVRIDTKPLRGGISADEVVAATAAYLDPAGRRRSIDMVVKRLSGSARREAAVYRWLERNDVAFAPRVLTIERRAGATTLFLERVSAIERWPWRQTAHGEAVLRAAAELHVARFACSPRWEYERELGSVAAATFDALAAARRTGALPIDAASLRALRRIVGSLCAIRREVRCGGPFARTLIHGDLHPGNVILSTREGAPAPVLLDWGRARVGSPLEDVASWVQTLGCWEPEARVRHDSLVAAYLRARGCGPPIVAAVRHAYWLAGASNALAGALLHHLDVATSRSTARGTKARSAWAVRDGLRVIRRAEAVWLEPERAARRVRARRTSRSPPARGSIRSPRWTRSSDETSSTSRS
jgi:hypothetical protein